MVSETSELHVYNALQSQSLRDQLHIPYQIWKKLEPALKKRIDEVRGEIRAEEAEKSKSRVISKPYTTSQQTSAPVPQQYPNMVGVQPHTLVAAKHVAIDETSDSETDDDVFHMYTVYTAHMYMCTSDFSADIEIRVHLEYAVAYSNTPEKLYAISDGGADSCVLGKYARVINETGRYATLVGYDPMKTRSKRIPIVSAYVKVRAHNQIPIILKINEAPYHENNSITLLSEYQIREHGYLIDSVATKHLKSENEYGTQQLTLSRLLHVPFEDRGGIMGFEILPITDQDMHNGEPIYDVFEITSSQIWKPARYRTEQKTHVAKLSAEPCQ
jgi:hypothetical protein